MTVRISLRLREAGKEPRTVLSDLTPGDSLIMGRGQRVQLWINDKNISREHCRLSCEDNRLYVEDLRSRNGTFLDGERVVSKTPVASGQTVRLASTSTIQVVVENELGANIPSSMPSSSPDQEEEKPVVIESKDSSNLANLPHREFSLIGETFNGYKIEEKVASGLTSIVYKGKQLALGRDVAIKTLSQSLIQNPKSIKRFLNVAKVSVQLTHPNIVQIYDSGSLDQYGIYYIVMEYVHGESFKQILEREQKLKLERAYEVILHIAGTIAYAHKKKIIHRDINPSNILLGEEGVPKIIGLGLSKSLDDEVTSLTQPGQSFGLAGYNAPEQLMDATKADHRADIYSLGAVFYHFVCGSTPYDTKNMREYFSYIREQIPPVAPKERNSEIPTQISNMILKALRHEPSERYQNIQEFIDELKSFITPRTHVDGFQKAKKQINAMLPSRTSVPGLEFESIYRPCEEIGGDFYDFIELDNNKIGIIIGDVSGHGAEAAVVVGMIKSTLKIFAKQCPSIAEAFRLANQEVYPDLDPTTFATVFCGIIDRNNGTIKFARAGHNPLIIYNPSRSQAIRTYNPKGMALGMFRKCECQEMTLNLQAGDCLIQYTDGVTEAMNADKEEFGLERLCQIIERSGNRDLRKILNNIVTEITEFMQSDAQQDDIALIGIKVL